MTDGPLFDERTVRVSEVRRIQNAKSAPHQRAALLAQSETSDLVLAYIIQGPRIAWEALA